MEVVILISGLSILLFIYFAFFHNKVETNILQEYEIKFKQWKQEEEAKILEKIKNINDEKLLFKEDLNKEFDKKIIEYKNKEEKILRNQIMKEFDLKVNEIKQNEEKKVIEEKKKLNQEKNSFNENLLKEFDKKLQEKIVEYKQKEKQDVENNIRQEFTLQLTEWRQQEEVKIREDAIKRSASVIQGKVNEHLVPYMSLFKYNPSDVRFLGSPIDLIVFDGMNEDEIRKIIFIEVKTGKSSLSTKERKIRDCILNKNIEYELLKIEK